MLIRKPTDADVFGLKNNMTKKILILGGNGFIGSNLAEFFVHKGENVIVFGKKESNYLNLKPVANRIKIIKGDFNSEKDVQKIFEENAIDIVVHLVSSVVPATPFDEIIKNKEISSTMKLLDIMHKKGVHKIIFLSSGGAIYGMNGKKSSKENSPTKPINFHGWSKLAIETYIQMYHITHKMNYLILRASNVYGKNQNTRGNLGLIAVTLGKLLRGEQIEIWGDGKVVRDYIYIDDLSKTLYQFIEKDKWNDVYNIGSGKGTSVNKILDHVKKVSKIDFEVQYKTGRKIDVPFNILNISKIKSVVKHKITPIHKGVQETYIWYKNNSNV